MLDPRPPSVPTAIAAWSPAWHRNHCKQRQRAKKALRCQHLHTQGRLRAASRLLERHHGSWPCSMGEQHRHEAVKQGRSGNCKELSASELSHCDQCGYAREIAQQVVHKPQRAMTQSWGCLCGTRNLPCYRFRRQCNGSALAPAILAWFAGRVSHGGNRHQLVPRNCKGPRLAAATICNKVRLAGEAPWQKQLSEERSAQQGCGDQQVVVVAL